MKLTEKFRSLPRRQQQLVVICSVIGGGALLVATFWSNKVSDRQARAQQMENVPRQVSLNPDLLRESAIEETRRRSAEVEGEVRELTVLVDRLAKRLETAEATPESFFAAPPPPPPGSTSAAEVTVNPGDRPLFDAGAVPPAPAAAATPMPDMAARNTKQAAVVAPPPPLPPQLSQQPQVPAPTGGYPSAPAPGAAPPGVAVPQAPPQLVGGIVSFANTNTNTNTNSGGTAPSRGSGAGSSDGRSGVDGEKKKKANGDTIGSIYLPPSIMPAKLLTGLDASTSEGGNDGAEPMLLRVQAPAILPNYLRASLRGCFVIAEGVGRLDKERISVRLLSLHCLHKDGHAVIDSPIKGFVADVDGKAGLAGHVVSRMGSAAARAMIAGAIAGAGDALQSSATVSSVSGVGVTQVVDTENIARSAFGGALSKGVEPIVELYTDLARQASPIVEALPGADITAILTEGVTLDINYYEISATY